MQFPNLAVVGHMIMTSSIVQHGSAHDWSSCSQGNLRFYTSRKEYHALQWDAIFDVYVPCRKLINLFLNANHFPNSDQTG